MFLFEKLLLLIAIFMQICNILVIDRFLIKKEVSPILFETYLNSMGADLAPAKKSWQLRTTRKGISLNHRSFYKPETALQMWEEMQQGIAGVHSICACWNLARTRSCCYSL